MSTFYEKRIEKLEAQVYALQQLLLSHVLAFDSVDRAGTDATIEIAETQRVSMIASERLQSAIRLGGLIETIEDSRR